MSTHGSEEVRQAGPLDDQQGEWSHGQSVVQGLHTGHYLVESASQTSQCHYGIHLERKTEFNETQQARV